MSQSEVHTLVSGEELARTFDEQPNEVSLKGYAFEDWVTLLIFWAMATCVFLQFFTRYVLNDSFAWTEEIATYCLVAIVFLGSSMCVRLSRHIQVDFLYRYMSEKAGRYVSTAIDIIRVAFFAYAIRLVWRYIQVVGDESMTTIQFPKTFFYYIVFAGFVLMLLRSIQVLYENYKRGFSILERPAAFDALEG